MMSTQKAHENESTWHPPEGCSKALVPMVEFVLAISGAMAVAKGDFEVVHFRRASKYPNTLMVCACNENETFVALVRSRFMEIRDEHSVVEISKKSAHTFATANYAVPDGVEGLLGMYITESEMIITDESGMSLTVYPLHRPLESTLCIETNMEEAAARSLQLQDLDAPVKLNPQQAKAINSIIGKMKTPAAITMLQVDDPDRPQRALTKGSWWSHTVSPIKGESLAFEQAAAVKELKEAFEKSGSNVVVFNPTKGAT